jgi:hypothetical protein
VFATPSQGVPHSRYNRGMEYHEVPTVSNEEMIAALQRNDPAELVVAVLGLALYNEDRGFSEETCVKLARHSDTNVRAAAIVGFGHLARRFRVLNEDIVRPIIEAALGDPSGWIRGKAEDAADDVVHFLGWQITRAKDST